MIRTITQMTKRVTTMQSDIDWLQKLPGHVRHEAGLEWRLWRRLPLIAAVGTALPALVGLAVHLLAPDNPSAAQLRTLGMLDYSLIGLLAFVWTSILTAAIGCVVVMVMKGPGYVADGYEIEPSPEGRRSPWQRGDTSRATRPVPRD